MMFDVALYSLIGVDRRFRRAYCLHHLKRMSVLTKLHGATSQNAAILVICNCRYKAAICTTAWKRYGDCSGGDNTDIDICIFDLRSTRSGNLEVPRYFLKAKQGYTVRKQMEKS
jgi:hypothetical protein